MTLTHQLIEAVHPIRADQLRPAELAAVRSLLLDHVGVVARGSQTESAASFRRFVQDLGYKDGGTLPVIGTSDTATAISAAMANAVAGHSIEYDDVHNGASCHPGVVIFPAAFAATALAGADDEAFLRGVVVGYEVMCRIGRAANPPSHYARHFHPTGTAGALGAAAAAAAVFGLDVAQTVSAVGIAVSGAAGNMQFLVDGAWTKRLHPALAARTGVEAALLAQAGYVGTSDGIGGARGFLASYSEQARPELLLAEWGERPLEVVATSVKAHTCCRYNQGPIDAVLAVREEHGLQPDEVSSVTIGLLSVAVDIVAEPLPAKRRPGSVVDAQFSLPYGVAVALADGRAGLDEYRDEKLADPAIAALMGRVGYAVDPDLDRTYPEQWRAWATIETADGRSLEARVDDPKGDPGNPLTPEELTAKFRSLTAALYTEGRQHAVEGAIGRIGEAGAFRELVSLLA